MTKTFRILFGIAVLLGIGFILEPQHVSGQAQNGVAGAIGVNSNITQVGGASGNTDPCGSWGVAKQSAVVTAAAASTTQIVAGVAGQTIFVCGYQLTQTTAVGTLQWEYGTNANCAAGTTTLTGAMPTAAGISLTYGGGEMTIFATPSADFLCLLTAGTAANAAGVLTYVQRVAGT